MSLHKQKSNSQLPGTGRSSHHHEADKNDMGTGSEAGSDLTDLEKDLEAFAKHFSRCRIKLGVSQKIVVDGLCAIYGKRPSIFSRVNISRFENWSASNPNKSIKLKRMKELRPFLEKWLEEAENSGKILEMHREHSFPIKTVAGCSSGTFFFILQFVFNQSSVNLFFQTDGFSWKRKKSC